MKWIVSVGDEIKSFDRICEVQSNKTTVEITKRYDGRVMTLEHAEGSIVKVGDALMEIHMTAVQPKLTSALRSKERRRCDNVNRIVNYVRQVLRCSSVAVLANFFLILLGFWSYNDSCKEQAEHGAGSQEEENELIARHLARHFIFIVAAIQIEIQALLP